MERKLTVEDLANFTLGELEREVERRKRQAEIIRMRNELEELALHGDLLEAAELQFKLAAAPPHNIFLQDIPALHNGLLQGRLTKFSLANKSAGQVREETIELSASTAFGKWKGWYELKIVAQR